MTAITPKASRVAKEPETMPSTAAAVAAPGHLGFADLP